MSQARLTRRHAMAAVAVAAAAPLAFAQAPNAYKSLSYDPFKDFVPIVNAASFELAMVVHKNVPVDNVAEFVAWAKGQGDKVSFASYGAGTPSHFLGECSIAPRVGRWCTCPTAAPPRRARTSWAARYRFTSTPSVVPSPCFPPAASMREDTERWGRIMRATNFVASD